MRKRGAFAAGASPSQVHERSERSGVSGGAYWTSELYWIWKWSFMEPFSPIRTKCSGRKTASSRSTAMARDRLRGPQAVGNPVMQ